MDLQCFLGFYRHNFEINRDKIDQFLEWVRIRNLGVIVFCSEQHIAAILILLPSKNRMTRIFK